MPSKNPSGQNNILADEQKRKVDPLQKNIAMRTAFVARFIVLREGRRSRAHRIIEEMTWNDEATAEELYELFHDAFKKNGDKLQPVERDLKRALAHAGRSLNFFIGQYTGRATHSFREALDDYEKSNALLFGEDSEETPRTGGWRLSNKKTPNT